MNPKIIITCAVTGAGDTSANAPVPVRQSKSPTQLWKLPLPARRLSIAMCVIPKPEKGSRRSPLQGVMERIRARTRSDHQSHRRHGRRSGCWPRRNPDEVGAGTSVGPVERLLHVAELRPELSPGLRLAELRRWQYHGCANARPTARTGPSHQVLWREARDWKSLIPEISGSPSSAASKD